MRSPGRTPTDEPQLHHRRRRSWNSATRQLAVVSGAAVAVAYLAQPLLGPISATFDVSLVEVGLVVAAAQIGYAMGALLLIPLSDRASPRRQVSIQLALTATALLAAAIAPAFWMLCLCLFAAGAFTNVAQVLVPMALRYSAAPRRGYTNAVLASASLLAVFVGRLASSYLAEVFIWQVVFLVFGVVALAMIPWFRSLVGPGVGPAEPVSYRSLYASLPRVLVRSRVLPFAAARQSLITASFGSTWTVVALVIAQPPYAWSSSVAGLVSFAGIAASVLAPRVGVLVDRAGHGRVLVAAVLAALVGSLAVAFASGVAGVLVVGLFLLTLSAHGTQVAHQSSVLLEAGDAAGRANTVYTFVNLVGGAVGAAAGVAVFSAAGTLGWGLFGVAAVVLACALVLVEFVVRRRRG